MKLAAQLPEGASNGLGVINKKLIEKPHDVHVVIMLVDCKKTTKDNDSGDIEPTVRVRRVEVVTPDDKELVVGMLARALEQRTGQTALPLGITGDLKAAFGEGSF